MVGERAERTIPRLMNAWRWTEPPTGKREIIRKGESASRTINDSDAPDPGGGHHPAWKRPMDDQPESAGRRDGWLQWVGVMFLSCTGAGKECNKDPHVGLCD